MSGTSGKLTVRLHARVSINAISIDHIPKNEALNSLTAPRMFRIYGYQSALSGRSGEEGEDWGTKTLLGQGAYSLDEGALYSQTFPFTTKSMPVQYVTFEFLNNHGHPDFTCVYRVRVHGDSEEEMAATQGV